MKPPQGLALIKFPDGFEPEMAYQLRERDPPTLKDLQRGVVSVEENMISKRARMKNEKRVTYREKAVTSTSDTNIDNLIRTMEKMMERINLNESAFPRENQATPPNRIHYQNQNFRRNPPQIRQREQRGTSQQIKPPFHENYVDQDEGGFEEPEEIQINLMGVNDEDIVFLTKEEQGIFSPTQIEEECQESEDYKQGFENAIKEVHRKYDLRRRKSQ